jgi:GntR family transcriptional regulator
MASSKRTPSRLRTSIDRRSAVPYYVQLKDALIEQIEEGHWRPGDKIPGDADLCRIFGVSRTVVRQALNEMAFAGLVVREKGRGTFVSEPKISSRSLVHSLAGFYQDMVERGLTPIDEVLEQGMMPASKKVAAYLKLEPMTPVIKLTRLRFLQDEPTVLVTSYLPYELCRELVNADLSHQSLYAFLEKEYGLSIVRGRRKIDAVAANDYEAGLFKIEKGSPLLMLDSVSYLDDGTPLEYFHGLFRGDRMRFDVEIVRIRGHGKLGEALGEDEEDEWPW